jgi:hypothetical protein
MLQAGKARVPDPMRWINSSNLPNSSSCLGVYLASNRNEYQKQKNKCSCGIECGRCVELTTLPPSVSRFPTQCGILNISQLYTSPLPVMGVVYFSSWSVYTCFLRRGSVQSSGSYSTFQGNVLHRRKVLLQLLLSSLIIDIVNLGYSDLKVFPV